MAQGGEDIGQAPARGRVHQRRAGGGNRDAGGLCRGFDPAAPGGVVRPQVERSGEPAGVGKALGQPAGVGGEGVRIGIDEIRRHQQRQAARQATGEVEAGEAVVALVGRPPPAGDEA